MLPPYREFEGGKSIPRLLLAGESGVIRKTAWVVGKELAVCSMISTSI